MVIKMLVILLIAFCLCEALMVGYLALALWGMRNEVKNNEPLPPITIERRDSR